jgi:hypothetical protein
MDRFYYFSIRLLQEADPWMWGALALALLMVGGWLERRTVPPWARIIARMAGEFMLLAGLSLAAVTIYQTWYIHRPLPTDTQETLFEGVTYNRDVRPDPRPLVIHMVSIDLDTPGLEFLVTPGDPSQEFALTARTTSQFLDEFELQVAVNGDFFSDFWTNGPEDYFPHTGDPVNVTGVAVSRGTSYGLNRWDAIPMYLSFDNIISFREPVGEVYNAVSGNTLIVENGVALSGYTEDFHLLQHPRTAAALDEGERTLMLMVVDGRQEGYSEGVSIPELADIAIEYGAYTALNLDGGGSSTLVIEGENGQPVVLNSPIDQNIPGRERVVANHLGVYVAQ